MSEKQIILCPKTSDHSLNDMCNISQIKESQNCNVRMNISYEPTNQRAIQLSLEAIAVEKKSLGLFIFCHITCITLMDHSVNNSSKCYSQTYRMLQS